MKQRKFSKFLVAIMAFMVFFCYFPVDAFAAAQDPIKTGYYNSENQWVEGKLTQTLPEGIDSVDKTAKKIADNKYELTLKVVAKKDEEQVQEKAATVLVIDTSKSMNDNNRLENAKKASKEFIDSYAGQVKNTGHYLAVVDFSGISNVDLQWTDVSTDAGKQAAKDAIDSLSAYGGTNLHAGILQSRVLFNDNVVKSIAKKNKSTILLTDGAPTYNLERHPSWNLFPADVTIGGVKYDVDGSGSEGSKYINDVTAAEAKNLKALSTVYTVCYGAKDDVTYDGGPTVSEYLANSIATSPDNAFNADNQEELFKAFADITSAIVHGFDGKGLKVTDGAALFVGVSDLPSAVTQNEDGFIWELDKAEVRKEGSTTYYTYTMKYTVTLDADNPAFEENKWYPLNGQTYLTLGNGQKVYFPIPAAQGVKTRYTVTYNDGVDGEEVFKDQVNEGLIKGDKTPAFKGTPKRPGYTFKGWTPEVADKVTGNAVYTAKWEQNKYTVTYKDGADGKVFADKITKDLVYGDKTPAFGKDPERAGYTFKGWKPEVADKVTDNAVYVAQWKVKPAVPADPDTGDNADLGLWMSLMALSLAGVTVCGRKKYQK